MLFNNNSIKFDEVTFSAINEELRILFVKNDKVAIFARSSQNKKNKLAKSDNDIDENINREVYNLYKIASRKYVYSIFKC